MKRFKPGTIKHYKIKYSEYYVEVSYGFTNNDAQHVTLVLREASGGGVRHYASPYPSDEWFQECIKNIKEFTEDQRKRLHQAAADMANLRLGIDEVDFEDIIGG